MVSLAIKAAVSIARTLRNSPLAHGRGSRYGGLEIEKLRRLVRVRRPEERQFVLRNCLAADHVAIGALAKYRLDLPGQNSRTTLLPKRSRREKYPLAPYRSIDSRLAA